MYENLKMRIPAEEKLNFLLKTWRDFTSTRQLHRSLPSDMSASIKLVADPIVCYVYACFLFHRLVS